MTIPSNNDIRPLCLSFRAPPSNRPQSILISKMVPEWITQGVKPAVITYEAGGDWDIDAPVYKIKQFDINKYLNRIPPVRGFLRRQYYKKIIAKSEEVIKKHNLNIIFSFSNPQESNIIGAMLKKRLGIPFVSYFSDPWYDYPYDPPLFFWTARKILKQESFVAKNSDKIVFVNNQARELIMKKFPSSWNKKAEVVPHCYEPKDYPQEETCQKDKFIFSYIGIFYKDRNPEIFFKAFYDIFKKSPEIAKKIKIKIVGIANNYTGYGVDDVKKAAEKYNLHKAIELIPPVSYKESLRYMKLSDFLIVLDLNIPNSPFLPSKVVDYAGSGSFIIGITPEESPTRDFLNNLGYKVFNYNQVNELSGYLEKLISGEIKIDINQDFLKQYDVSATTAKLINIFREVLDK